MILTDILDRILLATYIFFFNSDTRAITFSFLFSCFIFIFIFDYKHNFITTMPGEDSVPIDFGVLAFNTKYKQIKKPFVIQLPPYIGSCKLNDDSILLEATSSKPTILIDSAKFQKSFFKNKTFQTCIRD